MTRLLMSIFLVALGTGIARADCIYDGQVYANGERNPLGQVCDGQSGYEW